MVQNDDLPVYEGPIPLEEVRKTHKRILERAEELLRGDEREEQGEEDFSGEEDIGPYAVSSGDLGVYVEPLAVPEPPEDTNGRLLDDGEGSEEEKSGGEAEAPEIRDEPVEEHVGEPEAAGEQPAPDVEAEGEPHGGTEPLAGKPAPVEKKSAEGGAWSGRQAVKVKMPIAVKLVLIVTALLVLSLGALTALVSVLVSADVRLTAEDNNFSVNRRTAEAVQTRLHGISAAVTVLYYDLQMIISSGSSGAVEVFSKSAAARYFFEQNPRIAAIIYDSDFYINETFFAGAGVNTNMLRLWNETEGADIADMLPGNILLRNVTPFFGWPMLVMRLPLGVSTAKVFFDSEALNTMLGEGDNISFLLNEQGDVILHHDINVLRGGANLRHIPFVKNILDNSVTNRQSIYTDDYGDDYFGAVQRLNIGNTILITIIRTSIVFNGIVKTTVRNIALSIFVLFVSIFFIVLFSRTMSKALRSLTGAVRKIEDGNYDLQLKVMSNDELGLLTESFIGMGNNLENFEKFTNKTIVKLAKQGKLFRSGENKKTTVCFAFIRDFHEVSDGLDADAIVDFVNDYLRMMVPCITRNGGSVDKFLTQGGVIIMALWGTPETAGSPKQDALNCIRAALSMRASLRCLNESRIHRLGRHIPLIKLGCGVNTGEIVAGQIGSEERMEYTVIGDAVNLAARLEGPNDLFDTDILISEETYRYVGDYLITKEMQSIKVKGKEKPLRIFAVVNIRDPEIGKAILDDLENFDGVDIVVCKKSIGSDGPRNIGDVRRGWQAGA
ncbi:MAG: HAMP domain-containing protein [Spirochaetaceae bacterium]|jgi:adenylate cyclase|nr:HAMP domain-containing protein [Spirochaetaceae bacterium]